MSPRLVWTRGLLAVLVCSLGFVAAVLCLNEAFGRGLGGEPGAAAWARAGAAWALGGLLAALGVAPGRIPRPVRVGAGALCLAAAVVVGYAPVTYGLECATCSPHGVCWDGLKATEVCPE